MEISIGAFFSCVKLVTLKLSFETKTEDSSTYFTNVETKSFRGCRMGKKKKCISKNDEMERTKTKQKELFFFKTHLDINLNIRNFPFTSQEARIHLLFPKTYYKL